MSNPFEYNPQAPAPAASQIKAGVPPSDPNHWRHHRRAQTDAELLELGAAIFEPIEELEQLWIVASAHPDVFAALPYDRRQEVEAYAARRQRAIDGGKVVPEPTPNAVRRIDMLAQLFRETADTPPELVDVDGVHRARLVPIARAHGLGAAFMAEVAAWEVARQAAREFRGRQAAARRALGFVVETDGAPSLPRLRVLREFARAIDDPSFER